jgi:zinc protease
MVLALFATSVPGAAQTPELAPVEATFANGMHVIVLPDRLAPVAMSIMRYGVGQVDDTQPGISHATEHMLFRGTTDLSAGQLADIAARMGATYNAVTGAQDTIYYYKLPAAYIDVALHIEADRMQHATIAPAAWSTERGAIEQEIRADESVPLYKVGIQMRETFFKGTPLEHLSPGTIPSFEKMTAEDIRAFYHTWYQPSNATLIVSGDVDPAVVIAHARMLFASQPNSAVPAHAPVTAPPLVSSHVDETIDFPLGFSILAYRFPAVDGPDGPAAFVLARVLAGGQTALADLTTQGKVLGTVNLPTLSPDLSADFLLALPAGGAPPESAATLVRGVLAELRTNGIPAELVDKAKIAFLASQLSDRASISGLGLGWAQALEERAPSPDAIYARIAEVSADDVNRVLRTYLVPDHELDLSLNPKPTGAPLKASKSFGVEKIGFTPTMHEQLPVWAQSALRAPLQPPSDDVIPPTRRLPNGLGYLLRQENAAPIVELRGFVRTDPLLHEPAGKDGVSLILSSLLPYGTTEYDRKAYEAQVDALGASVRLGTEFELTVPAKDFEQGVALLADGLLHPAFGADAFAVVKNSVLQSVTATNALPQTKADLAQRLVLYPAGDPRRRDVTAATIGAVSLDDVKNYYAFAYRPDETTIAVVGDVSAARVQAALTASFGGWTAVGPKPSFRYPTIKRDTKAARAVTVKSASVDQSSVTLKALFAMKRSDRDYVPLLLANTMLSGESTGSLLFEELRTHRGYVYSVSSNVTVNATGGEFSVSYASDPKNVRAANAEVKAIVKRLQAAPLAAVELQRAKALLLSARILPLDSYSGVADDLLSGPRYGYDAGGAETGFWSALVRTTPADVERAMRRIDPDRFVQVIVEPDH